MRPLNDNNFKAIINTGCAGQNIRDTVQYFVYVTTHAQLFALKKKRSKNKTRNYLQIFFEILHNTYSLVIMDAIDCKIIALLIVVNGTP